MLAKIASGASVRRVSDCGLGGEGRFAGETAGLLQGLGGLGEEAPEDMEVVGVHSEQLETGVHPAILGVVGELAGLLQERIAGGGLDQHRRQVGQVRGQGIDQRIIGGMPGQVQASRDAADFV